MHETPRSVSEWAEQTFGPCGSNFSVAVRANREMAELLSLVAAPELDLAKVGEELADVVIVLWRLAERNGIQCRRFDYEPGLKNAMAVGFINSDMARLLFDLSYRERPVEALELDLSSILSKLFAVAEQNRIDLQLCIDLKMIVNRGRSWQLDGNGHGYHLTQEAPHAH